MKYMKIRTIGLLLTFCFFIIISCSNKTTEITPVLIEPSPLPITECGNQFSVLDTKGWSLIFDEEFKSDLSKWNIWRGGAFNNELQYYRGDNLFVTEDKLLIKSSKEAVMGRTTPWNENLSRFDYVSGRIESKETFGPTASKPIRIMARIKLPRGTGIWPAFWTYNDPWPSAGEIDILEARGHETNKFQSVYHFGDEKGLKTNYEINNYYFTQSSSGKDLADCYHIYELFWGDKRMEIWLDGKKLHTFQEPKNAYVNEFMTKKHRIILNLAVGGGFFHNLDKNAIAPNAEMLVDWVKVFSKD
jgi:beta-glucanase (GH16 family)